MELIHCGKKDARAVLVLYKYCSYFRDFVGMCFGLVVMLNVSCFCPTNHRIVLLILKWNLEKARVRYL